MKKGRAYKRDIGVYDIDGKLLYVAKACISYSAAMAEYRAKINPTWLSELTASNI